MPVRFKIDVLAELKKKGFSSYKMRQEKLMGEATIQQLRKGELVSWENIGRIWLCLTANQGTFWNTLKAEYFPALDPSGQGRLFILSSRRAFCRA